MANWFGMPRKGSPRIRREPLSIVRAGQRWSGFYEIDDGRLHVCSAYGSRSEPVGRTRDLAKRATTLFKDILDDRGVAAR